MSILISALIKFYFRDIASEDAQEFLDFFSGFLLGIGVSLPLKFIFKKKN